VVAAVISDDCSVHCIEELPRWKGSRVVGNKRKRSIIIGWKSAVCHGEEEESCGGKVCCAACHHWGRESVKVTKQQIVSIMTAAGEVLEERTPT
jgi:hypothetical protein